MNRSGGQLQPNPLREGISTRAVPQPCCIGLALRLLRIVEIGEQGEVQLRVAVGQEAHLERFDQLLVSDPQTSGGLLMAVPPERLSDLLKSLERRGVTTRAVIGEVVARTGASVEVV